MAGDPPTQPITDFTLLYEQANISPPLLDQTGDAITDGLRAQYPDLFNDVEFQQGPVKGFGRTASKLIDPDTGQIDPSRAANITDLVRGRIVVDTPEQIRAVQQFLTDNAEELGIKNVKDRFAKPSGTHYRDMNLSVELENGHIAEIQINQRDMLAASEYTHDAYEELDAITKRASLENRPLTDVEAARQATLMDFVQDVHDRGAAQVPGIDDLLNEGGQARLDTDHARRLQRDPNFVAGETLDTTSKYGAIIGENPDFLAQAEANGGQGYKALRNELGITVDSLEIDQNEIAKLVPPQVQWDAENNRIIAENPETLQALMRAQDMPLERLTDMGVEVEYVTNPENVRHPGLYDPDRTVDPIDTQRTAPLDIVAGGGDGTVAGGSADDTLRALHPPPSENITEGFNGRSDGADLTAGAPETTVTNTTPDAPDTTRSTVAPDGGTGNSRWAQAVDGAGGLGNGLRVTTSGAGLGLSAFHLKQQLLGENSTFHRDIQNDAVATEAKVALGLDVTAFALDSVDLTADLSRGGLALARSAGYIDEAANLTRLGSGISTLSKVGRVAGPVGTAITVVTTGIEYNIAAETDDGKRAGQAVGAGGGALGGAAIGAGIGVWFFGVGAAPGAAIGGIIGAFSGGYAGGELLDETFQEMFDEETLEEQQANLGKIEGIGENIDRFQDLEQQYSQSLDALQTAYEGTDVAAIEAAQAEFETSRMALTGHIETTLLTDDEVATLDSVDEFIAKQAEFYALKEQRLTEAGDTEALARLADSRAGLQEAATSIARLKQMDELIGEGYGTTQEEAALRAQEQIDSIDAMVDQRVDAIHTYNAEVDQQAFTTSLISELDSVNGAYNDGGTDSALMQRSAALMALVESGEMDQTTLAEAREEIDVLKAQHDEELATIKASQTRLQEMTTQQDALRGGEYTGAFAEQNVERLGEYNEQIDGMVASYEATAEVLDQALKSAAGSAAVNDLEGDMPTVDPALMSAAQDVQVGFDTALNQDVLDPASLLAQQENGQTVVSETEQAVTQAGAYEAQVRAMLDNGVEIDGAMQPIENEMSRQRLESMLETTVAVKQDYTDQVDGLNTTMADAEETLDNRVLSQNGATVYLDATGQVSAYSANGEDRNFDAGDRPMLVDNDAHIFNGAAGLDDANIELSLYNGTVVTKMGEPFQETKRDDRVQLRTIDDRSERREVRGEERTMTRSLRDRIMGDAVSPDEVIKAAEAEQAPMQPEGNDTSMNDVQSASGLGEDDAPDVTENAEYVEVAIAMERMGAGEELDAQEQEMVSGILNNTDTDPAIVEALQSNYATQVDSFVEAKPPEAPTEVANVDAPPPTEVAAQQQQQRIASAAI